MRTMTLVLAVAATCAVSPALARARILTVQDQTPPQETPAAPAPQQAAPPAAASPPAAPVAPPPQALAPKTPPNMQSESQKGSQAKSQDRAPPSGLMFRFGFTRVDNGFLRLDHKTGEVSYCTHSGGWSCEAASEKRASLDSLEKQVDELRNVVSAAKSELAATKSELAALKEEIAKLRAPPPAPPPHPVPPQTVPPSPQSDQTGGITLKLPSNEDIARARGFIAETWRRLVEMIETMQKDMMRKDEGDKGVSRT